MAIFIEHANFLFLGVPGTGSTSIAVALQNIPGATIIGSKHATVDELLENRVISPSKIKKLEIFCMVRNPFDTIHSEWFRSRKRWILEINDPESVGGWPDKKKMQIIHSCALEFSEFVELYFSEKFDNNQIDSLYEKYLLHSTIIEKFEYFDQACAIITQKIGTEIFPEKSNATIGRTEYWRDYNQRSRNIISTLFHDELLSLDYTF